MKKHTTSNMEQTFKNRNTVYTWTITHVHGPFSREYAIKISTNKQNKNTEILEKITGYHRSISTTEAPEQSYEIKQRQEDVLEIDLDSVGMNKEEIEDIFIALSDKNNQNIKMTIIKEMIKITKLKNTLDDIEEDVDNPEITTVHPSTVKSDLEKIIIKICRTLLNGLTQSHPSYNKSLYFFKKFIKYTDDSNNGPLTDINKTTIDFLNSLNNYFTNSTNETNKNLAIFYIIQNVTKSNIMLDVNKLGSLKTLLTAISEESKISPDFLMLRISQIEKVLQPFVDQLFNTIQNQADVTQIINEAWNKTISLFYPAPAANIKSINSNEIYSVTEPKAKKLYDEILYIIANHFEQFSSDECLLAYLKTVIQRDYPCVYPHIININNIEEFLIATQYDQLNTILGIHEAETIIAENRSLLQSITNAVASTTPPTQNI